MSAAVFLYLIARLFIWLTALSNTLHNPFEYTQTKKPLSITERLSAVRTGLEPVTPCVTGMYSNQLN